MNKNIIHSEEWRNFDVTIKNNQFLDEQTIKNAKKRIEKIRKRKIEITLFSPEKKQLPNKEVKIIQKSHNFLFGDQLWKLDRFSRFNQWNTDRAFYFRERFKEIFNAANALCYWTEAPRNDGPKIEDFQGRNITEHFENCVNWANSQKLTVKGHPLFWSIDKCVPSWLEKYDYKTKLKFAEVRVRNLVARFSTQINIWDAVNEALWEPVFKNLSQRHWPHIEKISDIADMVSDVLTWCKEENPDATFLINDYGLEQDPESGAPRTKNGSRVTAEFQRKRFIKLIDELKKRGFKPDAIGLQSHSGKGWISPYIQNAVFDELSKAKIPLHVTEFWAHTDHIKDIDQEKVYEMQAEYVKKILTVAFGHPAVEAFFFWGFIDDATIWDNYSGHKLKPLFNEIKNLIHKEWNSSENLVTDSNGKIISSVFHGAYSLRLKEGKLENGYEFYVVPDENSQIQKINIYLK